MVRLARGDVTARTAGELTSMFRVLRHAASLAPRLGDVIARLFATAARVVLRLSQYAEYPARV
eukprot:10703072-Lingulodinium_polyedra.AAC.1